MRIFILGLRRSGTTIFWEQFRQDSRLRSFNEPFNPALVELPVEIPNRSRREFIEIFDKDPRGFWKRFAPIAIEEELQSTLSDRQAAYLRFLLEESEHFCTDITRCHFKLEALRELAPDATVVHLYRAPAAFASSHLVPTGSGGFRTTRLRRAFGRVGFFSRTGRYDSWGMETQVGRHPASQFAHRLRDIGMDPGAVYALPAAGRLLAMWRVCYETLERDGRRLFGDRFLSVSFERFCRDPRGEVGRVYAAAGFEAPEIDTSRVKPAKAPYRAGDPRWQRLLAQVGIPGSLAEPDARPAA